MPSSSADLKFEIQILLGCFPLVTWHDTLPGYVNLFYQKWESLWSVISVGSVSKTLLPRRSSMV